MKEPIYFSASEKGWELIGTRGRKFKGEMYLVPKFTFYIMDTVNPVKVKFRNHETELFSSAPRSVVCSLMPEKNKTIVRCFSRAFRVLEKLRLPGKLTPEELERLEKEAERREELRKFRELMEALIPPEEREEEKEWP